MSRFWEGRDDGVRGRCSTFKAVPLMRNQDVRNPYSMFVNLTLCIMGSAWLSAHEPYHRAAINYLLYGRGDLSDENMFAREQINFKLWLALGLRNITRISATLIWRVTTVFANLKVREDLEEEKLYLLLTEISRVCIKTHIRSGSCAKMQPLALSGTQRSSMRSVV